MKGSLSLALLTVFILRLAGSVSGGSTTPLPNFTAYNIALQAQNPNQGNGDFVVKCVITNPVQIKRVDLIGLQKKNRTKGNEIVVLFITRGGNITWENQNLKKRPGLTATGDVSNVATAYLQLTIAHDQVQCEKDSDNYACFMGGRLASDGSLTTQFTGDYPVIIHEVPPTLMNGPVIRLPGSSVATATRRFTVGSLIQIECTGEIGSDPDKPNPSIRWCSKSAGSTQFTPMPITPSFSATQRNGCMYTKTSTLVYTVTPIDTETQFMCESGYGSACESGSAKGYVTISVDIPNIPTQARLTSTQATTTSGGGFFWLPVQTTMTPRPRPQTQRPSSGALECDTCSDFTRSQCDGNLAPCSNVCMARTHNGALITKCTTDVECEYQIIKDMIQPSSNTQCCTDNACFQKALLKGIHDIKGIGRK
ncbi:uncharacterized protein LOC125673369 [Ostrea edulis]|uniref:uncharacterized protein LOC125673369 n=1 Tax=Ostrea edulis TaxID=37623 RepID=UPI00209463AE|nr:uncharacterized protein LOC125673369 [Ostrea edulis]